MVPDGGLHFFCVQQGEVSVQPRPETGFQYAQWHRAPGGICPCCQVVIHAGTQENVPGFLDGAMHGMVMLVQFRDAECDTAVFREDLLVPPGNGFFRATPCLAACGVLLPVHVSRVLRAGCSQIQ